MDGLGGAYYGELGLGDTKTRLTPTQVGQDDDWPHVSEGEALLRAPSDRTRPCGAGASTARAPWAPVTASIATHPPVWAPPDGSASPWGTSSPAASRSPRSCGAGAPT